METGRLPAADAQGVRYIAPTDVAQFIRLEQCRRYLRLRLHERAVGSWFMRDYGVVPQSILPLLTRTRATFEETIERAVAARFQTLNCAAGAVGQGQRVDDNERVVALSA